MLQWVFFLFSEKFVSFERERKIFLEKYYFPYFFNFEKIIENFSKIFFFLQSIFGKKNCSQNFFSEEEKYSMETFFSEEEKYSMETFFHFFFEKFQNL